MSAFIKRMAHVALCVPDLDASVDWATTVMGLREAERERGTSYLTHAQNHHSLQYIRSDRSAVHHVSMEAHDDDALDGLVGRLNDHGLPIVSREVEERGLRRAIRSSGPEGHLLAAFSGMASAQ